MLALRVPAFPHPRLFLRAGPFASSLSPTTTASTVTYSSSIPSHILARTMSTAVKKEFLCILPDKPGVHAKRMEVRPSHLEGAKTLSANGSLVLGGAMLNAHPAEGETPSFKGSVMLTVAENEAEARKILENDIYVRSGVWDMEKAQIIPFKSAVREQL